MGDGMADRASVDRLGPLTAGGPPTWFLGLVTAAILLPVLYYGRSFFIPLAVALLVFILVLALGEQTRRIAIGGRRIPLWLARLLSLLIIFGLMTMTLRIVSDEVGQIGDAAPAYAERAGQRIDGLAPVIGKAAAGQLKAKLAGYDVETVLPDLLAPAGALFGSGILVLFYVIFMGAEREAFTRKLPRIVGSPQRAETVSRLSQRISLLVQKYMWINTLTSVLAGFVTYAVLWATGTAFASPLAILIFFTAFIPTIGTAFGIAAPAGIALIQFGFAPQFWIVLLVGGVLRLCIDNVVQPALAGRGLNLSPLMVMLALAFWGGLWGIAGAFLSVPLMVVFMIVCGQTPTLRPLAALMSADGTVQTGATLERNEK